VRTSNPAWTEDVILILFMIVPTAWLSWTR
jgi:hypothetical protein